jgi:hypothetical protein
MKTMKSNLRPHEAILGLASNDHGNAPALRNNRIPMKTLFFTLACAAAMQPLAAQDWHLLGNAGTNPNIHFLGTTDNKPLKFRVNNKEAGALNPTTKNTYFGPEAGMSNATGGTDNTAVGSKAMMANTTGTSNAVFGFNALAGNTMGSSNNAFGNGALELSTSSNNNSAFGAWAMGNNTTGSGNTALGRQALGNNVSGADNTAVGYYALRSNVAGSGAVAIGAGAMEYANSTTTPFTNYNTAVGYQALRGSATPSANTGNRNTAVGYQAAMGITSGSYNTAVGKGSLDVLTTGHYNTALGFDAMDLVTTGSSNTCAGANSDGTVSNLSNAGSLGYDANNASTNKVRIGNGSVTVVEGQVPYSSPSDARFKHDVQEDVPGLEMIMKLRPVTYSFNNAAFAKHLHEGEDEGGNNAPALANSPRMAGFLAQEVEAAVKELSYPAFDAVRTPQNAEDHYAVAYEQFTVPLVKAVQELQAENQQLLEQIREAHCQLSERLEAAEQRAGIRKEPGVQVHETPCPPVTEAPMEK